MICFVALSNSLSSYCSSHFVIILLDLLLQEISTVKTEQFDNLRQSDISTQWYIFIARLLHTVQTEQSDIARQSVIGIQWNIFIARFLSEFKWNSLKFPV